MALCLSQKIKDHISSEPVKVKLEAIKRKVSVQTVQSSCSASTPWLLLHGYCSSVLEQLQEVPLAELCTNFLCFFTGGSLWWPIVVLVMFIFLTH